MTVALRVTDDRGATQIGATQVTVQNVAPEVEAGGPYAGQVGNLITLVGVATDPGLIDQTGLAYRWEFGDGSQGSGPAVSHAYDRAGTYTVRLIVTDKDGASNSDTATVQVTAVQPRPQAPQAVISGPASGLVGEMLTFNGDGSSDSDGSIVSYLWEFGDGLTASGANVTHSYGAPGSYPVRLTIIDDTGLSATAALTVQITEPVSRNQPPTAVITGPVSGLVGESLNFDGLGSGDSDGALVDYRWEFGDGITASDPTAAHSFGAAGNYALTPTVTDDGGLSDTETLVVEITEAGGANP
jgi:PKD repeat protein